MDILETCYLKKDNLKRSRINLPVMAPVNATNVWTNY